MRRRRQARSETHPVHEMPVIEPASGPIDESGGMPPALGSDVDASSDVKSSHSSQDFYDALGGEDVSPAKSDIRKEVSPSTSDVGKEGEGGDSMGEGEPVAESVTEAEQDAESEGGAVLPHEEAVSISKPPEAEATKEASYDHPPTSPASSDVDGGSPREVEVTHAPVEIVDATEDDAVADGEDSEVAVAELELDTDAAVGEVVESILQNASSAFGLDAEKERVQSLITNLVGKVKQKQSDDSATVASPVSDPVSPPASGIPRGDQRAYCCTADEIARGGNDVYWTQTPETITLTIVLASGPASAREVAVIFGSASVAVRVCGTSVLQKETFASLDADSCLWSLDRSKPDAPALTLELEKMPPLTWWPTVFKSHDPSSYVLYQTPAAAGSESPAPAPPPPVPQAATLVPTDDAPPPDSPPPANNLSAPSSSLVTPSESDVAAFGKPKDAAERKGAATREELDGIITQYRTAYEKQGPGAPEAALQLATFYHHGIGVERNVAEAATLYRFGMENGVIDQLAAFQLGLIYNQGCPGLIADPKEAVRWWMVAAKLGNAVAMFNLGVMFMKGSGCVMDPTIAMRFFNQAHLINPKLRPPDFSPMQLTERVAQATRLKKERRKAELSEEDRQARLEEAKETLRYALYGTALVVGATVSAVLVRNWWRNRL